MWNDANNVVITGGQFTHVTVENSTHDAVYEVSTTLLQHIAPGALFDSAERCAAGRCHPGTRERIIGQITDWINDIDNPQRVLWLYGSAGTGKSAIMQTMCETLEHWCPDMYGGSFFFARGHWDRGKGDKLFPTLSYQLALHFPTFRTRINDTLFRDPTLPTKSMDTQLHSLLLDPLSATLNHDPVMLIDGLDECDQGKVAQCTIIQLVGESINTQHAPLRFIIASRPEYWIREAFENPPLSDITWAVSLRDGHDADSDIRLYLHNEFERIRLENLDIMEYINSPWPSVNLLNHFVAQASGQFIYASTIIKFVGQSSDFSNPQKQLRIISEPGVHRATAFSDLDQLYATILSAYPDVETMRTVLGGLLDCPSLLVIQHVLGVHPSDIILAQKALRSLTETRSPSPLTPEEQLYLLPIFGPGLVGEDEVKFCHLSFREFLQDKDRSGPYHVDVGAFQARIMNTFFRIIERNIDMHYRTEPHLYLNVDLQSYRTMMTAMSISVGRCKVSTFSPLMTAMTAKLHALNQLGIPMSYPACFIQDIDWLETAARQWDDNNSLNSGTLASAFLDYDSVDRISKFRETISVCRQMGLRLLSSCDGFAITTALMTIKLVGRMLEDISGTRRYPLKLEHLFIMPGHTLTDCISTFREHRHIISFTNNWGVESGLSIHLVNLEESENNGVASLGGWLSSSEWQNQWFLLVLHCLKSLLSSSHRNSWEYIGRTTTKQYLFQSFFDEGDISDICGQEYFENRHKLALLVFMLDTTAWTTHFPSRPHLWEDLPTIISPVLRWFNRQLTNIHTIKIIEEHDVLLLQRMKETMNIIFQTCFVPILTTPYFNTLIISTEQNGQLQSAIINPFGQRTTLTTPVFPPVPPEYPQAVVLHQVHCELFGTPPDTKTAAGYPIVKPSSWYPHFATYLLNVLAKYLHGYIRLPSIFPYQYTTEIMFRHYIFECLPYAEPSRSNLDALRTIKLVQTFVGNHINDRWCPPSGFGVLAKQFLEKYPRLELSAEELESFDVWLSALEPPRPQSPRTHVG